MGERSFLVEIIAAAEAERHELMHHTSRREGRRPEIGWLEAKPQIQNEAQNICHGFLKTLAILVTQIWWKSINLQIQETQQTSSKVIKENCT